MQEENKVYAIPPYTNVKSLDFEDYPFEAMKANFKCSICGSRDSYLDEIIVSDDGKRSYICSDTDYCKEQRQLNSKEEDQ